MPDMPNPTSSAPVSNTSPNNGRRMFVSIRVLGDEVFRGFARRVRCGDDLIAPSAVFDTEGARARACRVPPSAMVAFSLDLSNCLTLSFISPFRAVTLPSAGTDFAELRAVVRSPAGPETDRFEGRAGEAEVDEEGGRWECEKFRGAAITLSSVCTMISGWDGRSE